MKILGIVLGLFTLIILVMVILTFVFISKLDGVVADGIERFGSEATGTAVRVSGVDLSLRSGTGSVQGIQVANPAGFSSGDAFRLGEISMELDLSSLRESPIVIEKVLIAAPEIHYELDGRAQANLDVIMDHLESFRSQGEGDQDAASDQSQRIVVREFVFEEGRIEVDASALGGVRRSVDLPSLTLQDLGGQQGMMPSEMGREMLRALNDQARIAVRDAGLGQLQEKIGKEAGEAARDALGNILN